MGYGLEKRIRALEKPFNRGPIVVTLADGREHVIPLRHGETPLDVYLRVLTHPDSEEAQLIGHCLAVREPGRGRLLQLARALLVPLLGESLQRGSLEVSMPAGSELQND
jgi:hypothetical protein